MKNILRSLIVLLPCFAISGCELLCQAGTGSCGMSREQLHKLLHAKGYGEHFTKPGMTKESWRQDWVACGGMTDGGYSNDAPPGADVAAMLADNKRKAAKLKACMQSKGYEYRYEP